MKITKNHWLGLICIEISAILIWAYIILITHPSSSFFNVLTKDKWIGLLLSILIAILVWWRLILTSNDK
jgi:hypothetical protein